MDGKESMLLRGNSVCVGALPPSSTADAGIELITQFILLGPLQQDNMNDIISSRMLQEKYNRVLPWVNEHLNVQLINRDLPLCTSFVHAFQLNLISLCSGDTITILINAFQLNRIGLCSGDTVTILIR
jgi:hypothetical protein